MNNEILNKESKAKMNYKINYDMNDYARDIRNNNYQYFISSPNSQFRKKPQYIRTTGQARSPNYYNSGNNKYSFNTITQLNRTNNNNFHMNKGKIMNNIQKTADSTDYVPKNTNFSKGSNVMEIQQRFDRLQDKINYLQNVITNKEPSKGLIQNNNINNNNNITNNKNNINNNNIINNTNINNNYLYNPKFNSNTYNSRFNNNNINNINKNNNFNAKKTKDLHEIHNHMKNINPRESLIKKMTGYRTAHLEKTKNNSNINNINNINTINNINNKYERKSMDIYNSRLIQLKIIQIN